MPPTTKFNVRCQHCDAEFQTKRPRQAKWCPACRTSKAIIALGSRPAKCMACAESFYKHNRSQAICVECDSSPVGRAEEGVTCVFCDRRDRLMPGIKVCYHCQGATGMTHMKVVKAISKSLKEKKVSAAPSEGVAA